MVGSRLTGGCVPRPARGWCPGLADDARLNMLGALTTLVRLTPTYPPSLVRPGVWSRLEGEHHRRGPMTLDQYTNGVLQGVALVLGLGSALLLGHVAAKWSVGYISRHIEVPRPPGVLSITWSAVTRIPGDDSVRLIGAADRLVAFFSIGYDKPEWLAAWLALKLAAKWDAWANIIKVPPRLEGVADLDFLRSRVSWGARTYQRFIVGTFVNVLAGILGFGVYAAVVKSSASTNLVRSILCLFAR